MKRKLMCLVVVLCVIFSFGGATFSASNPTGTTDRNGDNDVKGPYKWNSQEGVRISFYQVDVLTGKTELMPVGAIDFVTEDTFSAIKAYGSIYHFVDANKTSVDEKGNLVLNQKLNRNQHLAKVPASLKRGGYSAVSVHGEVMPRLICDEKNGSITDQGKAFIEFLTTKDNVLNMFCKEFGLDKTILKPTEDKHITSYKMMVEPLAFIHAGAVRGRPESWYVVTATEAAILDKSYFRPDQLRTSDVGKISHLDLPNALYPLRTDDKLGVTAFNITNQKTNGHYTNEQILAGLGLGVIYYGPPEVPEGVATISFSGTGYEPDREKARLKNYTTADDTKAIFASDKAHQEYDYPMRSGYFLNPTGTFTMILTTETWSIFDVGPSASHREMVDSIIRAFRYESNLVYLDSETHDAVTITGQPARKTGTVYEATTVNNTVKESDSYIRIGIERPYTVTLLEEAVYMDSTHRYKLRETTTLTITINPNNDKLYTHPQLKNGEYYLRAYFDTSAILETAGIDVSAFDGFEERVNIQIVGSMYDDIR